MSVTAVTQLAAEFGHACVRDGSCIGRPNQLRSLDSLPRKMANWVYNAARWGSCSATVSRTAAEPSVKRAHEGAKIKDGFHVAIRFLTEGSV